VRFRGLGAGTAIAQTAAMPKKTKLSLNRETVRHLQGLRREALVGVAGGMRAETEGTPCSFSCENNSMCCRTNAGFTCDNHCA
jgi:hypothetical protein